MRQHTPKDQLDNGLWYLHVDYAPYYTVVSILRFNIGQDAGKLGVWVFDEERAYDIDDYADDQFICRVPAPEGLARG